MSEQATKHRPTSAARLPRSAGAPAKQPRARRDKLSISLDPADVRWVTRRAKDLGTSVSAVLAEAIAEQRRAEAAGRLLLLLGGADDLSPALIERARAEMLDP